MLKIYEENGVYIAKSYSTCIYYKFTRDNTSSLLLLILLILPLRMTPETVEGVVRDERKIRLTRVGPSLLPTAIYRRPPI